MRVILLLASCEASLLSHTLLLNVHGLRMVVLLNWKSLVFTYATTEQAMVAKEALDGADIYEGCCTLKIEFSKVRA